MPRETKAYLCEFRCGRHSVVRRKAMEDHEGRCKLNPARKTCATCKHEILVDGEYDCNIDQLPGAYRLRYDCPFHQLKSGRE